jgi:hypothetical protein
MMPSGIVVLFDEERWICTSGEVGLEVAMNDGNKAICCSEDGPSREAGVEAGRRAETPEELEGDGDGGSCMLAVDSAFPFDLSDQSKSWSQVLTNSCLTVASSSSRLRHCGPRDPSRLRVQYQMGCRHDDSVRSVSQAGYASAKVAGTLETVGAILAVRLWMESKVLPCISVSSGVDAGIVLESQRRVGVEPMEVTHSDIDVSRAR